MLARKEGMRNTPPSNYTSLDLVFESEINKAIKLTDKNYSKMNFHAAIQTGFYDLQVSSYYYKLYMLIRKSQIGIAGISLIALIDYVKCICIQEKWILFYNTRAQLKNSGFQIMFLPNKLKTLKKESLNLSKIIGTDFVIIYGLYTMAHNYINHKQSNAYFYKNCNKFCGW